MFKCNTNEAITTILKFILLGNFLFIIMSMYVMFQDQLMLEEKKNIDWIDNWLRRKYLADVNIFVTIISLINFLAKLVGAVFYFFHY